jgi:hypothetical protein
MSDREKKEAFWKDHKLYRENKKEQIDRTELFYILEQFEQSAKNKPNAESEGQRHLREYFSQSENTYFYDKNKI